MLSESESIELLHEAFEQGINFFDTARLYGLSEERMGKAFSKIRDKVVISTKCAHLRNKNEKCQLAKNYRILFGIRSGPA
jgi:aryl-alcohol dehydrogenase-like predicted oxidoreductase